MTLPGSSGLWGTGLSNIKLVFVRLRVSVGSLLHPSYRPRLCLVGEVLNLISSPSGIFESFGIWIVSILFLEQYRWANAIIEIITVRIIMPPITPPISKPVLTEYSHDGVYR